MEQLLDEIDAADALIFGSPVNFGLAAMRQNQKLADKAIAKAQRAGHSRNLGQTAGRLCGILRICRCFTYRWVCGIMREIVNVLNKRKGFVVMKKLTLLSLVVMLFVLPGCKGKEKKTPPPPEPNTAPQVQAVPQNPAAKPAAVQMVKCSICGKEFVPTDPNVGSKAIKCCKECTAKNNEKMAQLMKVLDMMKSSCPKCGGTMSPKEGADGVVRLTCSKCGNTRELK